jgi:hypothetical protein
MRRRRWQISPVGAVCLGLLAHLVGDYLLQSHWMAVEKTKRWWPAVAHAATYALPFVIITRNPVALCVIMSTHAVIDRYRLARHVAWVKNHLAPIGSVPSWSTCKATGYPPDTPPWLAVWLMILADNTIHICINSAALWWVVDAPTV